MKNIDEHAVNILKPAEIAYWSRILNVSPKHILRAVKATGSNLLKRMIWFLKAEGVLPHCFDIAKSSSDFIRYPLSVITLHLLIFAAGI